MNLDKDGRAAGIGDLAAVGSSSRFDRYYSTVLRSGSGYPTADEARKDLNRYDSSFSPYGWPR